MVATIERTKGQPSFLFRKLNSALFFFSAIALVCMCIPTVVDVLSRLAFSRSIPGAIELVEFSMVGLVFGGLAFVQDQGAHIRVTLLADYLPTWLQDIMALLSSFVPFLFTSVMAWCIFRMGLAKYASWEVSPQLFIPLFIFIFFAALGTATLALSLLSTALGILRTVLAAKQWGVLAGTFLGTLFFAWLALGLGNTNLTENLFSFGLYGVAFLMVLILLGMPMGFAMSIVGFLGMLAVYPSPTAPMDMLGRSPYNTTATYAFGVVPMFIFMGELARYSGISRDLFTACNVWLGRMPGGMLVASIAGCAGFAAVSGDSMATAVTMSSVAFPEMRRNGYEPALACSTLAAGGTLGILIPPSTGFIFYALVTETSIGHLFVAGIVPGILLALLFITYAVCFALRHPDKAPRGQRSTWNEKFRSTTGILPMMGLIALVLGGILFGLFSPNEGGAVGAAGTLLYALARRRLSWNDFVGALRSTCQITSTVLLVLIGVGILGYFFVATALPFDLADMVVNLNANKYVILLCVVLLYLLLGCLLNVTPMILLTLPAIFPSIIALGFDPVWFGVTVVILMECGQITPPVGINVFAMSTMVPDVPMSSIFKWIIPYFLCMMFLVLLLVLFPQLALWLPGVLF